MSLDDLTNQISSDQPSSGTSSKRKRSFAWLLPVGLLLGFVLILTLLFGERLIPATEVDTAPVITVRAGESAQLETPSSPSESPAALTGKGGLLFQASGWVEPDPYTVYASTLINGVVSKVEVLEGESVKKGDLLATLIDDDARLDLQEAKQKHLSMEKRIVAHCAGLEIVAAEIAAAQRKIEALD
jgi:multidrug efflux pump subunit AcrA (membrane-fusion protein)